MPDRSPLISEQKTGTPADEKLSASTCSVTVLPVPVAPVISPWRYAEFQLQKFGLLERVIRIALPSRSTAFQAHSCNRPSLSRYHACACIGRASARGNALALNNADGDGTHSQAETAPHQEIRHGRHAEAPHDIPVPG